MTDLESLDLSNNNFSGEIPQRLTKLTSLEVINVSYNLLVGPIPQGGQFGASDESSFVGNLGLCGIPLSKKCRNVDESWTPSTTMGTNDEEDDSDHLIDWIIRGLGCVSGFAAGCALGKYFTDRHHEWFVETFERRRRRKPKRKVSVILLFPVLTLSHASLQQQQLCHDQEKSALLQFRQRFIINSDIARHLSFCNLPQWVDKKLAVETDRKFELHVYFAKPYQCCH
ncbi:hypothetical protein Cgig2_016955 [Carnegiea gigantea]|uniref:Uncharacterized protein n=1 Tax=Carnegiea gigantea TaxID=171969 RepID=A0A9Q1QII4_9CARY|nr:hypothetical protein Cgig2_016955 [Carnegiea gigantea]